MCATSRRTTPPTTCSTRAPEHVPCAERYVEIDNECGAITYMDVRPRDVKPLGEFSSGDEVFIESDDTSHAFDSETEYARRNTHVWWRAKIEG
jgi:hypothetical protein